MSGIGADIVVSGGITMSEEPTIRSDLRIKNTIDYDLSAYEAFFLALKPSTFKYNKGTSGRTHFGFIAQDVEQAMLDVGLTSSQLAALVKDPVLEIFGRWSHGLPLQHPIRRTYCAQYAHDPETLSNGRRTASAKGGIMLKKQLKKFRNGRDGSEPAAASSAPQQDRLYRREELPDAFYCFD